MTKEDKNFVEMPTLTMYPTRKKGLPRWAVILGAVIMIMGLVIIGLLLVNLAG
jgi:hypothetical protein